jgi:replicative DNA helicase
MLHLADAGEAIDNVVLVEHLRAVNQLTHARGASYIAELTLEAVSAAHIASHARLISEKALIRKIQMQAVSLLAEIERGGGAQSGSTPASRRR